MFSVATCCIDIYVETIDKSKLKRSTGTNSGQCLVPFAMGMFGSFCHESVWFLLP